MLSSTEGCLCRTGALRLGCVCGCSVTLVVLAVRFGGCGAERLIVLRDRPVGIDGAGRVGVILLLLLDGLGTKFSAVEFND